jgi:DNA-binding response OmpR family regulator
VPHLLVAADADWVIDDVKAGLDEPDTQWTICHSGKEVRAAVAAAAARDDPPDLAVLDLQIGTMGGMAVCMDLRLEESGGRLPHVPVLMLLDRSMDEFLARRSNAEAWVVKPFDPLRLRTAARAARAAGAPPSPAGEPQPLGG